MKYVYGPVKSRRLGNSLGVSLTSYKVCNFDCVYCQLGKTTVLSSERKEYVLVDKIIEECREWLKLHPEEEKRLDFITFSGFGEPTLNVSLGILASELKRMTKVPLALLTNAALLNESAVLAALENLDLIVPSLDAATQDIFEKIDRPLAGLKIETIINALIDLRKKFAGQIWLEVMLIKGLNDDEKHIRKLKEVIGRIKPDKIQLNSPVRSTPEQKTEPLEKKRLEEIQALFGASCEIY